MAGGGRHNGDADREKLNTAAALGWRVLRVTPRDLETDPAGCIELAAAALILGGDPGAIGAPSGSATGVAEDAGGGDLPGDRVPTAPKMKQHGTETTQLQRRATVKLARRQPVKLTRREG
jgi:hypothetical protein